MSFRVLISISNTGTVTPLASQARTLTLGPNAGSEIPYAEG